MADDDDWIKEYYENWSDEYYDSMTTDEYLDQGPEIDLQKLFVYDADFKYFYLLNTESNSNTETKSTESNPEAEMKSTGSKPEAETNPTESNPTTETKNIYRLVKTHIWETNNVYQSYPINDVDQIIGFGADLNKPATRVMRIGEFLATHPNRTEIFRTYPELIYLSDTRYEPASFPIIEKRPDILKLFPANKQTIELAKKFNLIYYCQIIDCIEDDIADKVLSDSIAISYAKRFSITYIKNSIIPRKIVFYDWLYNRYSATKSSTPGTNRYTDQELHDIIHYMISGRHYAADDFYHIFQRLCINDPQLRLYILKYSAPAINNIDLPTNDEIEISIDYWEDYNMCRVVALCYKHFNLLSTQQKDRIIYKSTQLACDIYAEYDIYNSNFNITGRDFITALDVLQAHYNATQPAIPPTNAEPSANLLSSLYTYKSITTHRLLRKALFNLNPEDKSLPNIKQVIKKYALDSKIADYRYDIPAGFLDTLSEEDQEEIIRVNPFMIRYIGEQSDKLIHLALKHNKHNIAHIHKPSDELVLALLKRKPSLITEIVSPTESQIRYAAEHDIHVLKQFTNPMILPPDLMVQALIQSSDMFARYYRQLNKQQIIHILEKRGSHIQFVKPQLNEQKIRIVRISPATSEQKSIDSRSTPMQKSDDIPAQESDTIPTTPAQEADTIPTTPAQESDTISIPYDELIYIACRTYPEAVHYLSGPNLLDKYQEAARQNSSTFKYFTTYNDSLVQYCLRQNPLLLTSAPIEFLTAELIYNCHLAGAKLTPFRQNPRNALHHELVEVINNPSVVCDLNKKLFHPMNIKLAILLEPIILIKIARLKTNRTEKYISYMRELPEHLQKKIIDDLKHINANIIELLLRLISDTTQL